MSEELKAGDLVWLFNYVAEVDKIETLYGAKLIHFKRAMFDYEAVLDHQNANLSDRKS